MKLAQADRIADEVMEALGGFCERIAVAGSIRRRKPIVKDVEIVYIPRLIDRQVDLFTWASVPMTDEVIADLVHQKILTWDAEVKRRGPKYKRLVHVQTGVVVELFTAQPDNWGLILALRTGPADFNVLLVSKPWHGGAMPLDMGMKGGYLWREGRRLETPDEATFFDELGIPLWPPHERTAGRLRAWLYEVEGK